MLKTVVENAGFLACVLLVMIMAKIAFDLLVKALYGKNADQELCEKDNPAFGISFALYLAGVAYATLKGIEPTEASYFADLLSVLLHGGFAIMAMLAAMVINDYCILWKVRNAKEIFEERNIAVGIGEGGSFVATAMILAGAWTNGSWGTVLLWFAIGQAMLVAVTFLYQWITPHDIHAEIDTGNTACAIGLAGFLVGTALIVYGAIAGPATTLLSDLTDAGVYLGVGVVTMVLMRGFTGILFIPRTTSLNDEIVRDRNINAGLLEAAAYVIAAAAMTSFV